MATIDMTMLKDKVSEYLDIGTIVDRFTGLFRTDIDPLKIGADGKYVGLRPALTEIAGEAHDVLYALVYAVEKIAWDTGQVSLGKEKKQALVDFLDDIIDVGFLLEFIDGKVISILIDKLIALLNEKLGKDWVTRLPEPQQVIGSHLLAGKAADGREKIEKS